VPARVLFVLPFFVFRSRSSLSFFVYHSSFSYRIFENENGRTRTEGTAVKGEEQPTHLDAGSPRTGFCGGWRWKSWASFALILLMASGGGGGVARACTRLELPRSPGVRLIGKPENRNLPNSESVELLEVDWTHTASQKVGLETA